MPDKPALERIADALERLATAAEIQAERFKPLAGLYATPAPPYDVPHRFKPLYHFREDGGPECAICHGSAGALVHQGPFYTPDRHPGDPGEPKA